MMDDAELLRAYAENRSESAFARFVERRVGFVHAVALRMVAGDAHTAQDVTQAVFTLVAKKASLLAKHERLAGWLYTTTCNVSRQVLREARRRDRREQEAARMSEIENETSGGDSGSAPGSAPGNASGSAPGSAEFPLGGRREAPPQSAKKNLGAPGGGSGSSSGSSGGGDADKLRPLLDEALCALREGEREAVLLRYFEGRPFGEIGVKLKMSEEAARKRAPSRKCAPRLRGAA